MKYVKMTGLAAVTSMALMALGVAGASAAELYSTGVTVNAGTTVSETLDSGTSAVLTTTDTTTLVNTCTGYSYHGTIDTYGSGAVVIQLSSHGPSGCSFTTDTLTNGSLSINSTGTVSGKGTVTTINIGVSCRYGSGAGTILGTLTTGAVKINAVTNEQEPKQFLCPDTTEWRMNLSFTTPHDASVT